MRSKSVTRINRILLFFILLIICLYYAASILIPLFFGTLFAMLMHTVANYLEKKGMGRGMSATLCTLIVFVVITGTTLLLSRQLLKFVEDLPQLQKQLSEFYEQARDFIYEEFGVPHVQQEKFIQEQESDIANNAGKIIQSAIGGLTSLVLGFLLALVYMFLMLLNKEKYVKTLEQLVKREHREQTIAIGKKVSGVAQKYLWGRIQVMGLLGIMYLITFLAFDLDYAILLTVFGALITIIPYLGPAISGLLPVLIAILSNMDFGTVMILAAIVFIIHMIESYVLEPVIMGSEVNLSPLAIIIIIIVGGAIWGIAGMILFVPMLAMAKIYFDHMENLKPYGMLIGNSSPQAHRITKNIVKRLRRTK